MKREQLSPEKPPTDESINHYHTQWTLLYLHHLNLISSIPVAVLWRPLGGGRVAQQRPFGYGIPSFFQYNRNDFFFLFSMHLFIYHGLRRTINIWSATVPKNSIELKSCLVDLYENVGVPLREDCRLKIVEYILFQLLWSPTIGRDVGQ